MENICFNLLFIPIGLLILIIFFSVYFKYTGYQTRIKYLESALRKIKKRAESNDDEQFKEKLTKKSIIKIAESSLDDVYSEWEE